MLRRALPAILLLALPTNIAAETPAALCQGGTEDQSCALVLACIGTEGRWFHGSAGVESTNTGPVSGVISDGTRCEGIWRSTGNGLGAARLECEDGVGIDVLYTYREDVTGTAIGIGKTSKGEKIKVWSGLNVLDYFRNGSPTGEAQMKCGDRLVPIS